MALGRPQRPDTHTYQTHTELNTAGSGRLEGRFYTGQCASPAEKDSAGRPVQWQQHCKQHHRGAGVSRGYQGGPEGWGD